MKDEPATSNVVEVAAGLVFNRGTLLITQRPATGHLANLWEFPGGKREPNESFEECLHRELKEELDIEVDQLELEETVNHTYPEKNVELNFYRCRLSSGEPKTIDCQDFKWVKRGELADFEFPAADEKLLAKIRTQDHFWRVG